MNHYTTIEQSKKLLELGLNPGTADMHYIKIIRENDVIYMPELLYEDKEYDIPCWSLGALLEVMPKSLEDEVNYYEITVYYSGIGCEWYLGYITIDMRRTLEVFHNTSLIEAAYNMVVWLIENKYLKTDKQ